MAEKLLAVKGMNDILPPESARWEWLECKVRELMTRYAYRNIRTPILEHTQLFVRGIGEVTDIVEKEMYSFEDRSDKNGDHAFLSMRPENTASVVRAVTEHNLLYEGGKRFYYMGPRFRRERPQRGRYRQFHQIGAEALGFGGPEVDAELILLAAALWKDIGITDWRLEINSLGQPDERELHRTQLIAHFEQHADALDEDARRRLHSNPLRILDTKNPSMKAVVESAPRLSLTLAPRLLAGPVPEFVSLTANRAGDEAHGQALDLGGRYYLKTQPSDGNGLAGVYVGLKAEYQRLRPLYRIEMWGEDPGSDGLSYYTYRPRSFTETINRFGGVAQLGYQAQLVHPRLRIDVWVSASYLHSRSSAGEASRYNSGIFDYAYSGFSPLLGLSLGYVVK